MAFYSLKRRASFLNTNPDIAYLLMRIGFGGAMFLGHGMDKVLHFSETMARFPDPIGIGSTLSAVLATFAEFVCALAVVGGFYTRVAAAILAFNMGVAFFVVHISDHFSKGELAFLYFVGFLAIFFTGPGRHSVDRRL